VNECNLTGIFKPIPGIFDYFLFVIDYNLYVFEIAVIHFSLIGNENAQLLLIFLHTTDDIVIINDFLSVFNAIFFLPFTFSYYGREQAKFRAKVSVILLSHFKQGNRF
jgi:hypothetical protein